MIYRNFFNAEEKNLAQFSKNCETFYPKNLPLSSKKYGFGIRVQGSKRHRIPDPQHWLFQLRTEAFEDLEGMEAILY
jgi:hypothetical protein